MSNIQKYPPICPHCGQFNSKILEVSKWGSSRKAVWLHYPDGSGQTLSEEYLADADVLERLIREWAAAHIEAAFAAGVASVKGAAQ